ncbi:MAG: S1/P1 nuclease [Bacteroidetes bacterium]|nr:S1/P1 nuclease [Bacteroidota bacterium]
MIRLRVLQILFFLTPTLFLPHRLFAWGAEGHKMTVQVAKHFLNPGVEDSVNKYLGTMSWEEASVWMDEMRSNSTYDYMKPWHYANEEKGKNYEKQKGENIVNKLEEVISELKKKPSKTDLLILFHLMGDIHQPLHCGYAEDKGGNTVQLQFFGKGTNLHKVWDSEIIEKGKVTTEGCIKALKIKSKEDISFYTNGGAAYWFNDSRRNLELAYDLPNPTESQKYLELNKPFVELSIGKGGLQLAQVLNEIFK